MWVAVKGWGGGFQLTAQPSRRGESEGRERKKTARDENKKKKLVWRTFLKDRETHICLFRLKERWR